MRSQAFHNKETSLNLNWWTEWLSLALLAPKTITWRFHHQSPLWASLKSREAILSPIWPQRPFKRIIGTLPRCTQLSCRICPSILGQMARAVSINRWEIAATKSSTRCRLSGIWVYPKARARLGSTHHGPSSANLSQTHQARTRTSVMSRDFTTSLSMDKTVEGRPIPPYPAVVYREYQPASKVKSSKTSTSLSSWSKCAWTMTSWRPAKKKTIEM